MNEINNFVNRHKETADIVNDIVSFSEYDSLHENRVTIIYAKSGIGKSAFCRHILKKIDCSIQCINITIPYGKNVELNQGFYFRAIATEIDKRAVELNYLTFNDFLCKLVNKEFKKIHNTKIFEDLQSLSQVIKPLSNIIARKSNVGIYNSEVYLKEDNENFFYTILRGYVEYVIEEKRTLLLNIENIQNIDAISLNLVKELLKECGIYLLLEYTLEIEDSVEVIRFSENFKDVCNEVKRLKLKSLNFRDFCMLLPTMDENSLKNIYVKIDGNLRQIVDIESVVALTSESHIDSRIEEGTSYTRQNLKALNSHQLEILCLIAIHYSQVELSVIKELFQQNKYEIFIFLENELTKLANIHKLIFIKNDYIILQHDSIYHEIMNNFHSSVAYISAYSLWVSYYEKLLFNENYKSNIYEIIITLSHLYSNFEYYYNKLPTLFKYIEEIAFKSSNPSKIIEFLIKFEQKISVVKDESLSKKLSYFILNLSYELGLFDIAYKQIGKLEFNVNNSNIYSAMLCNRLLDYETAIEIADKVISSNIDNRTELCMLLIKMISYASINRYDKCEEIFNQIYKNECYTGLKEYGFFLRNSELVLPLSESLELLEESVEFFTPDYPIYAEHSRITLSMNQARLGMLSEAMCNLEIVKERIYNYTLEKHIILNNMCAIQMCDGKFDNTVAETLKLAGFYAITIFDKILIHRNLIIVLKKLNKYSQGERIIELLIDLIKKEKNQLNICYAYWNISYFFKHYDDIKYDYYYNCYLKCFSELKKIGLRKNETTNSKIVHKPNMEFVIGFISYWHFPLPQEKIFDESTTSEFCLL